MRIVPPTFEAFGTENEDCRILFSAVSADGTKFVDGANLDSEGVEDGMTTSKLRLICAMRRTVTATVTAMTPLRLRGHPLLADCKAVTGISSTTHLDRACGLLRRRAPAISQGLHGSVPLRFGGQDAKEMGEKASSRLVADFRRYSSSVFWLRVRLMACSLRRRRRTEVQVIHHRTYEFTDYIGDWETCVKRTALLSTPDRRQYRSRACFASRIHHLCLCPISWLTQPKTGLL